MLETCETVSWSSLMRTRLGPVRSRSCSLSSFSCCLSSSRRAVSRLLIAWYTCGKIELRFFMGSTTLCWLDVLNASTDLACSTSSSRHRVSFERNSLLNSSTEFRPLLLLVAVDDDATPSFDDVDDAEVDDEVMFGVLFILLLFIDGVSPSLKNLLVLTQQNINKSIQIFLIFLLNVLCGVLWNKIIIINKMILISNKNPDTIPSTL